LCITNGSLDFETSCEIYFLVCTSLNYDDSMHDNGDSMHDNDPVSDTASTDTFNIAAIWVTF